MSDIETTQFVKVALTHDTIVGPFSSERVFNWFHLVTDLAQLLISEADGYA